MSASDTMTSAERRTGAALAGIFGLRMLGLFLILPVFAVHARGLPGGADLTLVGLALGIYGLTQACLQIPFGLASDRFGRKPVIITGLLLFALGSAIAAMATSVQWVIVGRAIQGAGAISAAVTALAADLTREQHRTKVMAMIGSSIGLVFAVSLVAAPLLYAVIGMSGIFWLTAVLSVLAIGVLSRSVPNPPRVEARPVRFGGVLRNGQLLRLNLGIFTLHLVQMAMFVVIPAALVARGGLPVASHWQVYLPAVLVSFAFMVPAIIMAERKNRLKPVFLAAIGLLVLTQVGFLFGRSGLWPIAAGLMAFFVAFNILEATLPSLVSRIAPPNAKGAALGVYNTTQALGLFLGASLGGWLNQHVGADSVFIMTAALALVWLGLAATMRPPPKVASRSYSIAPSVDIERLRAKIVDLPGVREAVIEQEARMAHLKVNLDRWDEARLRQLIGGEV
jgi:MFS family permease